MDIKPITITNFGILTGSPIRKEYTTGCWNDISKGKYKDYSFVIYNNYQFGKKGSTLIILRRLGTWVKSKLKYMENNKRKVLWSYADDTKKGFSNVVNY